MNIKTFPTLYRQRQSGAIQTWTISTEDNVIVTRWGQEDGSMQESRDEVKEGKNIGRSNATTPTEQAQAEAQSKWERKLKRGHVQERTGAKTGQIDAIIEGGVWPMLAHRFDKVGHKINFPAFTQPKFDGHRCVAIIDDKGKCALWSRSRKPITSLPHIVEAYEALDVRNMVFDGELYNHK